MIVMQIMLDEEGRHFDKSLEYYPMFSGPPFKFSTVSVYFIFLSLFCLRKIVKLLFIFKIFAAESKTRVKF